MRKPSTRKIVTPAATATKAAKAAKAAKPVTQPNTAETIAPEFLNAEPVSAADTAPATAPETPKAAKPSGGIVRTAATVVKQLTNFGSLSDRDTAYLAFYASLAKAASDGAVTLAGIVQSGRRPEYAGSNKPHDAGVIVRLTKAGLIAPNADGHSFTFTATGKSQAAYTKA
jgi:hypothetical protein